MSMMQAFMLWGVVGLAISTTCKDGRVHCGQSTTGWRNVALLVLKGPLMWAVFFACYTFGSDHTETEEK